VSNYRADSEWDKFQASLPLTSVEVSTTHTEEFEDDLLDTRQDDEIDTTRIESEIRDELEQQQ